VQKQNQIMRTLITSPILSVTGLAIALALGFSSLAQNISDPASLPKDSFHWNQEEIELGFSHFDEVYKGREVPNGSKVHQLPQGLHIAAFNAGGEKEKELEDFLTEQEVAGLLILQDGKIRLERYALGYSESGRWTSMSVAKSVTSTLVGAAIKDGYIKSVDNYVTDYIPDLKGSAYEKVTIRHLLTMTTGVRWTENYTDPNSDIARFYTAPVDPGIDETVSYMRRLPAEAEPGKKWVYKTGETHLLGVLVSSATGQTLSNYLSSKIWIPYGMEEKATWILGRTNEELAGCCLQMKLRDFGRFGQFVLEGGRINGESIVPDDWFQTATHTQIPLWGAWGYGYQWWTFNDGTFEALGIHGQMIHIDPARRLVVAINSAWPEAESNERRTAVSNFLNTIVKEIDEEKTESPNPKLSGECLNN
jgi:CubicO group peptidase (beta-lactamase class C family)